jgi:hypothetical protein
VQPFTVLIYIVCCRAVQSLSVAVEPHAVMLGQEPAHATCFCISSLGKHVDSSSILESPEMAYAWHVERAL